MSNDPQSSKSSHTMHSGYTGDDKTRHLSRHHGEHGSRDIAIRYPDQAKAQSHAYVRMALGFCRREAATSGSSSAES